MLEERLSRYAAYHRDRRNLATHFVGIPLIVFGLHVLLARPVFQVAGAPFTPALVITAAAWAFYLALDVRLGVVMVIAMGTSLWLGRRVAEQTTPVWLWVGLACFLVGWALQFVGHVFEGRRPAFVDDLVGLLVGPLFLVVELAVALGMRPELRRSIEP